MERKSDYKAISILFLWIWLSFSCNNGGGWETYIRLQHWDDRLEEYPEAVVDSLREIDPLSLSPANRAYYGLLKTIADDKAYTSFTSDSLISEVVRYYGKHQHGTDDHIRSLIYQGVVRHRIGIGDTTVYMPLNEARKLFSISKVEDPANGYFLNYYLGEINFNSGNYSLAGNYYRESLRYARLRNNERHVFDVYTALFWNEMTRENYEKGKLYLDTLLTFSDVSVEIRYNILNMESVYYDVRGDFNRSLQCQKEIQRLIPFVKHKEDSFRILFSISDKYKNLHQPDSAMSYGLQAIEHIRDTTYQYNWLLYKNVADIALLQGNYKMAEEYRGKMFDIYQHFVNGQMDNKILELEKRYDLSVTENIALKAKANTRLFLILSLILLLLVALILSIYYKHRKIARLQNAKLEAEKRAAESESELLHLRTEEQKNIIRISSTFLSQYLDQSLKLKSFKNKFTNTNKDKKKLEEDFSS